MNLKLNFENPVKTFSYLMLHFLNKNRIAFWVRKFQSTDRRWLAYFFSISFNNPYR